jgi:two-component system response regulator HupR/HoxA
MYKKPVKAKILIVDADKSDQALYATALDPNFKCYFANNVQDAWEILYEYAIQVIITDEKIEKMTGIDFLTQVQKQYPEIVRLMIANFKNIESCMNVNDKLNYQHFQ